MGFLAFTSLAQHHSAHSGTQGPCGNVSIWQEDLQASLEAAEPEATARPPCPPGTPASAFAVALAESADKPYSCPICQKPFKHLSELSRHERIPHGREALQVHAVRQELQPVVPS